MIDRASGGGEALELEAFVEAIRRNPRLHVEVPSGACGTLSKDSIYGFTYADPVARDETLEVALGLPYRQRSYQSGDLFSVFAMNEPEGFLRLYIEEALSRLRVPNKLLFLALTQGLQVGRVGYRHPDVKLPVPGAEPLERILGERSDTYFDWLLSRFALRSGLSGAQPKVAIPAAGGISRASRDEVAGTWDHVSLRTPSLIVKDAGFEYPGLALNEFFCMSVAHRAGLSVPRFWLSEGASRFVIERFDRAPDGQALGFEDMVVLSGQTALQKYLGSYEMIMRIARTYCSNPDAAGRALFARIAASVLLRDGNAHLKNFGLVYDTPAAVVQVAPAYDIVCTALYPDQVAYEMALKMHKTRRFPMQEDLVKFASKMEVDSRFAQEVLERIRDAIASQLRESREDPRFASDPAGTLAKLEQTLLGRTFRPREAQ